MDKTKFGENLGLDRNIITDEMWAKLLEVLRERGRYQTRRLRKIIEAILWRIRIGSPWRDIPRKFCPWETAYNLFQRWSKSGLWRELFQLVQSEVDL